MTKKQVKEIEKLLQEWSTEELIDLNHIISQLIINRLYN